jgi:hypothetical protein
MGRTRSGNCRRVAGWRTIRLTRGNPRESDALRRLKLKITVNYKYARQPITPLVAVELIAELFAGRCAERREIAAAVARAHETRGGAKPRTNNLVSLVHKALKRLARAGRARNQSYGQWEILGLPGAESAGAESPALPNEPGQQWVYLYFYPAYRRLAKIERKRSYPCKIGHSSGDPDVRVFMQTGTALPESPVIARKVETRDAFAVETMVHCVLRMRGRAIREAPGSEWFLTTPGEFDEIVRKLTRTVLPSATADSDGRKRGRLVGRAKPVPDRTTARRGARMKKKPRPE